MSTVVEMRPSKGDWRMGRRVKARNPVGFNPTTLPAGSLGTVLHAVHGGRVLLVSFDGDSQREGRYVMSDAVTFEPPCRVCAGEGEEVTVNNGEAGGITREPCYRCEGKGTVPFGDAPITAPGPEADLAILREQVKEYAAEVYALRSELAAVRRYAHEAESVLAYARLPFPRRAVDVLA